MPPTRRPHAASKIGGLTPSYNGTGSLTSLGSRSYTYDLLDRLATATEDGNVVSEFAYDAAGRRAKNVDKSRPQHRTHHYLSADFEWNETLELGSIHLSLGGKLIATIVEPHDPSPAWVPPASDLPPFDPRPIGAAAGVVALLLLLQLAALRRRGIPIARPLVAGATAWSFALFIAMPTGSAPTDGDVTEDGKLDAGDLLLMERFALGLTADSTDLLHGDIAPLEGAPENPSDINVADVVLLSRALQGEDVDGDGLFTYVEVVLGASPFLADSDFDGVRDDLELAGGSDPACHSAADSDCDGVSDTTEDASGRDRYDPDTDGDGLKDNTDPLPRSGVRYYHADHLNSPMLVTGSAGIVVARFTYTPYGKTVPAKAPVQGKMTFGFTSQRFESAIGIYDYGARWYDAAVGRFLQPDPVVPDPGSPQALNRYAYALNNPANLIDPSGNLPIVVDSLASPAIGGSDPGTIGYTPNGSYYSSNYDYYYGYDSYFGDGPSPYGGTFPYRSLYYDYANGYADSFHNNFLSQTNLTREIQMNAYEGYNNLVADINRFRWANPDTAIPLSGPRMDTYADYWIKTTGDLRSSNAFSYNYGMISNADTDFFRPWGGETFRVSGLGVLNGLHGGSDINYFMQGVRTAAGGGSVYWMDFRISAWNLFDRSQMPAAMMWARYGYDRYNWYHHQTGGR